jgi:hypothetical protein
MSTWSGGVLVILRTSHSLATVYNGQRRGEILDKRGFLDTVNTVDGDMLVAELFPELAEDQAEPDGGDNVEGADSEPKPGKRRDGL